MVREPIVMVGSLFKRLEVLVQITVYKESLIGIEESPLNLVVKGAFLKSISYYWTYRKL